MMKILKITLFLFGACLLSNSAFSQQTPLKAQKLPLKISILDESISLPTLWFLNYSYNPALMIGTEYIWKENNNYDWHFTANLGGYHHKEWQSGIFVNGTIGYRYHLKQWNTYARFGLGYAHTFETNTIYEPNNNGGYETAKNFGNPNLMTSFNFGIGYELKDIENSPEIFLTYMTSVEVPLNIFTGVHQFVGLGVKFYPFN